MIWFLAPCLAILFACAAIMCIWLLQDIATETNREERGLLWFMLVYLILGFGGPLAMMLWQWTR